MQNLTRRRVEMTRREVQNVVEFKGFLFWRKGHKCNLRRFENLHDGPK